MQPVILYCYDAYCNWCYAFSPVITKIAAEFDKVVPFEVLSGGMIITDEAPKPISIIASYLKKNCQTVSQQTGAQFGEDFMWHINNPDLSDWFPCSEKPAVALCVFKEYYPDKQVAFTADLTYALQYEGRDLCDDEAYRHLLAKYNINADTFYALLNDPAHKEKAVYEFELCKQLHITGFPTVLMQVNESKFILLAEGYTPYDVLRERIKNALKS